VCVFLDLEVMSKKGGRPPNFYKFSSEEIHYTNDPQKRKF
jgi:hypothetical protein